MADTVVASTGVDTNTHFATSGGTQRMLVETSASNIYWFYKNTTGDLVYRKSTNGGTSFGSEVSVHTNATAAWVAPSVWFDKWTSGNTGTKIHIAFLEQSTTGLIYMSLNTASDTLSGETSTDLSISFGSDQSSVSSIAVARGGNIYISYSGWDGSATRQGFYRSTDSGATFTSRAHPHDGNDNEAPNHQLLPGNEADNQDMWMSRVAFSFGGVRLSVYDDSANTWANSDDDIGGGGSYINSGEDDYRRLSAAIRHSDGHCISVYVAIDDAASDIKVIDSTSLNSHSVKTDIATNADDLGPISLYIDQNTDELFVFALGKIDGSETWGTSVNVYVHRSTNGGTSWSTTQYSESTAANLSGIFTSHSSPGAASGRACAGWFNEGDADLLFGATNSVEVGAAGGGGDPEIALIRGGKLVGGGLLLKGGLRG